MPEILKKELHLTEFFIFCEIFLKSFSVKHLQVTASVKVLFIEIIGIFHIEVYLESFN